MLQLLPSTAILEELSTLKWEVQYANLPSVSWDLPCREGMDQADGVWSSPFPSSHLWDSLPHQLRRHLLPRLPRHPHPYHGNPAPI